jgi:hypothetical protein
MSEKELLDDQSCFNGLAQPDVVSEDEEPGTFRTGDFGYLRGAVFLEPFPLYLVGGFVSQR